jgi:hypothetical protein
VFQSLANEVSEEEMGELREYIPTIRHLIHQVVGSRLHWKHILLNDLTDRQKRQSRWILTRQASRA